MTKKLSNDDFLDFLLNAVDEENIEEKENNQHVINNNMIIEDEKENNQQVINNNNNNDRPPPLEDIPPRVNKRPSTVINNDAIYIKSVCAWVNSATCFCYNKSQKLIGIFVSNDDEDDYIRAMTHEDILKARSLGIEYNISNHIEEKSVNQTKSVQETTIKPNKKSKKNL